jgi:hypothetical protein
MTAGCCSTLAHDLPAARAAANEPNAASELSAALVYKANRQTAGVVSTYGSPPAGAVERPIRTLPRPEQTTSLAEFIIIPTRQDDFLPSRAWRGRRCLDAYTPQATPDFQKEPN